MAQVLYYWDKNNQFDHSELLDELPTPLPANATTVVPANGLYDPISWNGNTWTGVTLETWLAARPDPEPAVPTTDQKAQAQLALQLAKTTQAQATFNAQVLLELADLKKAAKNTDTTVSTN